MADGYEDLVDKRKSKKSGLDYAVCKIETVAGQDAPFYELKPIEESEIEDLCGRTCKVEGYPLDKFGFCFEDSNGCIQKVVPKLTKEDEPDHAGKIVGYDA